MCTVSWLLQAGGYELLCNRDERHTRKPASGPRISKRNEISYIAPVDGDHGGSWIGVNEFGLTLCLLNRYGAPAREPSQRYTSRGLLLTELLDSRENLQISERVEDFELDRFRPFSMLVLSGDEPAILIEWTGQDCRVERNVDAQMPLTSSSLRNPTPIETRRNRFEEIAREREKLDVELLHQFHLSHVPERGPYSVCMHRDDAATVSLSTVTVTRDSIEFIYQPGSPCLKAPAAKVVIARTMSDKKRGQARLPDHEVIGAEF
jgi:uncharacterized protein with NRDE domain